MTMTFKTLMTGCAGLAILTTGACMVEDGIARDLAVDDATSVAHQKALANLGVSSRTTVVEYGGLFYPVVQSDSGSKVRYFVASDEGGIEAETLIDCDGNSETDCELALGAARAERNAVDKAAAKPTGTRRTSAPPATAPGRAKATQTTQTDADQPEAAQDTDTAGYDYAIDEKKPVTLQVVKGDTWQVKHDGKMLDCEMNSAMGCSLAISNYKFENAEDDGTVVMNTKKRTVTSSDDSMGDGGGR